MSTATAMRLPSAPDVARPQRRVLFDAARYMAAIAIVWLHTPSSVALQSSVATGRFAVPFFTASMVFFVLESLTRGNPRTLSEYASNRFMRLYVPFLAWAGVYLLFKLLKLKLAPNQPNDFPGLSALLTGGFYHLWFLPFALVVSLAAFAVGRRLVTHPCAERWAALASACGAAVLATLPVPTTFKACGPCAEYWWMALPSALGGLTMFVIWHQGGARRLQCVAATFSGLAITVVATAWTWHVGRSSSAETISGLGFMLFALGTWNGPALHRLAAIGPLAYGIYLSHLLFIKTCESLLAKCHCQPSVLTDVSTFVIAVVGSTLLARMLAWNPRTRWLAP